MGQSSSRSQRSTSQNAAATSTTSQQDHAAAEPSSSNAQPGPSSAASSRSRSSLRQRVASMIKPSSQRDKEDVGERSKRRMSKSPAQPQVTESAQQPEASSSRLSPPPAAPSDKGKSRADGADMPEEPRPDSPAHAEAIPPVAPPPPPSEAPVSPPAPARAHIFVPAPRPHYRRRRDPEADEILARWRREFPDSSDEDEAANANQRPPVRPFLAPQPTSPPPNATARQFPPPGTLVVVQGIVHTADVSRPSSDRPNTEPEARGGPFTRSSPPSSLGRSSTDSSPPNSSETPSSTDTESRSSGISPGSVDVLGTLLSVAAAATAASLLTGSSEPIVTSGLAPPGSGTSNTSPTSPPVEDATFAASRAERMRQAWSTIRERLGLRPTPPPGTSLGGLGAGLGEGNFGGSGSGVTDTRELMLAEMARAFNIGLGLNGFGTPPSAAGSTATTTTPEGDVRASGTVPVDDENRNTEGAADANEGSGTLPPEGSFDRFLVDLQADLRVALTGDGEEEGSGERQQSGQAPTESPSASTPSETPAEAPADSHPPPPASTPPPLPPSPTSLSMNAGNPAFLEESADDDDDDMPELASIQDSSEDEASQVQSTDATEDPFRSDDERRQFLLDLVNELGIASQNAQSASTEIDGDATPRGNGPRGATADATNSQSTADATPAANADSTAAPAASGPGTSTGSRNGRMDESGRINWWRLYRFPAINSPPASPSTSPAPTTSASPAPTPTPSDPTPSPPGAFYVEESAEQGSQQTASTTPSNTATSNDATPATTVPSPNSFLPSFLPPPSGQTVVPVIVVGLQSVAAEQFGLDAVAAHIHAHAHPHGHGHAHEHTPAHTHAHGRHQTHRPSGPVFPTVRDRQEELAVLQDMLREAEAEAEADALLYDSLERLARNATHPSPAQARGENGLGPQGGLFGNQNQSQSQSQSRGQRTTVEEVEDEDADDGARPRTRSDLDELFAADEALDLDEADDEHEDTDEEEEEEQEEEEAEGDGGVHEDEEGRDDYYRRSDRNARARAMAQAEAKKEAKEERKRRKEAREAARAARAARIAAAAERRANAAARASTSASASGSRGANGPRLFEGPANPLGGGNDGNGEGGSPEAWLRYADQLRNLATHVREEGAPVERPRRTIPRPRNPFAYAGMNGPAPALGLPGTGAMAGGAGTGVGMGTGLPGGAGSRTFLIYVIGGYYPPDHSIVTGGPESFESFEALLELAEMLGHGKPPTVTKEEIARSGLETIKPAQLAAYEEQGRIASNCTERCLICLDDYAPEDDIRVMSCRHAFHQACVDTWLQTGRNNCPACRSTGVNATDGTPATATV